MTSAGGLDKTGEPARQAPESAGGGAKTRMRSLLFLMLIFSLAIEKPAVLYPVEATDLIFVALVLAIVATTPWSRYRVLLSRWNLALLVYLAALSGSLFVTSDVRQTCVKLAETAYLVGLAFVVQLEVGSVRDLIVALRAWLAGVALVVFAMFVGVVAFLVDPDGPVYEYLRFPFGTLPPGHYPRVCATFFNANMLCNYLTASLAICLAYAVLVPDRRRLSWMLAIALVLASLFTLSPGLGGIALATGLLLRSVTQARYAVLGRVAAWGGAALAILAIIFTSVTPIVHPTAPFVIKVPALGWTLAPSGRYLTWSAAWQEFQQHPWLGHGIGIDAVGVRYITPGGEDQWLTDAHNTFLNIAAQTGWLGLLGMMVLLGSMVPLIRRFATQGEVGFAGKALAIVFLNAFAYQGLTGSYEDARFLWVLLGLILAIQRIVATGGPRSAPSIVPPVARV